MQPWEILGAAILIGPLLIVLIGMILEFTRCGLQELLRSRAKYYATKPRGEVYRHIDEINTLKRLEDLQEKPR